VALKVLLPSIQESLSPSISSPTAIFFCFLPAFRSVCRSKEKNWGNVSASALEHFYTFF
jgi:hypothetical protein